MVVVVVVGHISEKALHHCQPAIQSGDPKQAVGTVPARI
jgi:hypothetical protein